MIRKQTTQSMFNAMMIVLGLIISLTACTGLNNQPTDTASSSEKPGVSSLGAWDVNSDGIIVVGFSQIWSRYAWNKANNQSFRDHFIAANGFQLLFSDADGDDAVQKAQVRAFINQGVEVIILQPLNYYGWELILQEAKDKGIPVINSHRILNNIEDLIAFQLDYDFRSQADRAVAWLEAHITTTGLNHKDIRVVYLQAMVTGLGDYERVLGFEAGAEENGWTVVRYISANYTRSSGEKAMAQMLETVKPQDFNVIWCDSDEVTAGAIDALLAKGLDPKDYIIISFGGGKTGVQMIKDGLINAITQAWNPLYGPQLGDLILRASKGEVLESPQYVTEEIIDSTNADQMLLLVYDDTGGY
jgi:ABC-type sugar transport system substrate-binding protein